MLHFRKTNTNWFVFWLLLVFKVLWVFWFWELDWLFALLPPVDWACFVLVLTVFWGCDPAWFWFLFVLALPWLWVPFGLFRLLLGVFWLWVVMAWAFSWSKVLLLTILLRARVPIGSSWLSKRVDWFPLRI